MRIGQATVSVIPPLALASSAFFLASFGSQVVSLLIDTSATTLYSSVPAVRMALAGIVKSRSIDIGIMKRVTLPLAFLPSLRSPLGTSSTIEVSLSWSSPSAKRPSSGEAASFLEVNFKISLNFSVFGLILTVTVTAGATTNIQ